MFTENFVIDGNHLLLGPVPEKHDLTIPFSQLLVRKCIIRCKVGKPFAFWKLLLHPELFSDVEERF